MPQLTGKQLSAAAIWLRKETKSASEDSRWFADQMLKHVAPRLTERQLSAAATWLRKEAKSASEDSRRFAGALLRHVEPQLSAIADKRIEIAEHRDFVQHNKGLVDVIVSTLPTMVKRGLTRSAVIFTESVKMELLALEKNLREQLMVIIDALPNAKRKDVRLPMATILKRSERTHRNLLLHQERYLASTDKALKPSKNWGAITSRKKIAYSCFKTGIESARRVVVWEGDDVEMIALEIGDQLAHFKLGVAILDGNPKKIKLAFDMDTACSDKLSKDVYCFGNEVFYGESNVKKMRKSGP